MLATQRPHGRLRPARHGGGHLPPTSSSSIGRERSSGENFAEMNTQNTNTVSCRDSTADSLSCFAGNSLGASLLILLVVTGGQRVIGLVRNVLFCCWLSPEQLGVWDLYSVASRLRRRWPCLAYPDRYYVMSNHFGKAAN
jgi:hypothetical protein